MKTKKIFLPAFLLAFLFPTLAHAQVSQGVSQLNTVLDNVYNQMIPLCSQLLDVCQALAAFGTTFYIGYRVWKHIAHAEPIDFFPLFRPFVITILISIFPQVLGVINGILSPTVTYTASIVQNSNAAVQNLLMAELEMPISDTASVLMTPNSQTNQQNWDKYTQPGSTDSGGGGFWSTIGAGFKFFAGGLEASFRYVFKFLLSILLEVLYYAAELCIDAMRTFHLIVLGIMGPFAFAISCYDGFHHSLTTWLGRYINIYLWLPVANLFGAILGQIQQNMLQIDLARLQSGTISLFSATDFAYLIFLLIGIVGYTCVPGLTNYIVHTHGPNPLSSKVTGLAAQAVSAAVGGAAGGAGGAASGGGGGASAAGAAGGGYETTSKGQPYDPYAYNRDKIGG